MKYTICLNERDKYPEKPDVKDLGGGRCCAGDCFPADTPVATSEGWKNIGDITAGDEVWAWSSSLNEQVLKKVTRVTEGETDMLIALAIGNDVIETTATHSFYSEGEWVDAGALEAGDKVMLFNGKKGKVLSVDLVIESDDYDDQEIDFSKKDAPDAMTVLDGRKQIKVYNLEVEDFTAFYIGQTKVLVQGLIS